MHFRSGKAGWKTLINVFIEIITLPATSQEELLAMICMR